MDAAGTLATVAAPFGAVAAATAVVLRDVVASDRARREPVREPAREREPVREPVREREPARPAATAAVAEAPHDVPVTVPVVEAAPADYSMLGALTVTDEDVRSPLRRVASLLLLLALTLMAAAVIGAGIYKGLSGMG